MNSTADGSDDKQVRSSELQDSPLLVDTLLWPWCPIMSGLTTTIQNSKSVDHHFENMAMPPRPEFVQS